MRGDTEDLPDLIVQRTDIVSVALLSESAEAVQILPDLRGGQPHLSGKLLGGDPNCALCCQLTEKPVIARQAADHRR